MIECFLFIRTQIPDSRKAEIQKLGLDRRQDLGEGEIKIFWGCFAINHCHININNNIVTVNHSLY